MAVNMVTLPEPESGTKRPKLTTPKYDAFAMVLSAEQYKLWAIVRCLYGSEIVYEGWSLGGVIGPGLNISQENALTTIMAKCHFRA